MRKILIGVMGPGNGATAADITHAYELGTLIAQQGWVLLTGGRKAGVMDAASRGAKAAGGLTVGVLPTSDTQAASEAVDIAIVTGIGEARNAINVLSSNAVIACGMGLGTASEIALALKHGKSVILLTDHQEGQRFFRRFTDSLFLATSPQAAIEQVKAVLQSPIKQPPNP